MFLPLPVCHTHTHSNTHTHTHTHTHTPISTDHLPCSYLSFLTCISPVINLRLFVQVPCLCSLPDYLHLFVSVPVRVSWCPFPSTALLHQPFLWLPFGPELTYLWRTFRTWKTKLRKGQKHAERFSHEKHIWLCSKQGHHFQWWEQLCFHRRTNFPPVCLVFSNNLASDSDIVRMWMLWVYIKKCDNSSAQFMLLLLCYVSRSAHLWKVISCMAHTWARCNSSHLIDMLSTCTSTSWLLFPFFCNIIFVKPSTPCTTDTYLLGLFSCLKITLFGV